MEFYVIGTPGRWEVRLSSTKFRRWLQSAVAERHGCKQPRRLPGTFFLLAYHFRFITLLHVPIGIANTWNQSIDFRGAPRGRLYAEVNFQNGQNG